jgi:hypothetical protein
MSPDLELEGGVAGLCPLPPHSKQAPVIIGLSEKEYQTQAQREPPKFERKVTKNEE